MLDITIKDYCFYTIQSKRPATKCLFNYTCSISLSPAQNTYLPDRKTPWQWRAELFWLLLNFPLHQSIHRLFAVTGWYCLQTVFVFHPPFSATLFFHFQKHTSRTRKHHGSLSGSRRGLTSLLNSSEKITYWLTNSPAFAINHWTSICFTPAIFSAFFGRFLSPGQQPQSLGQKRCLSLLVVFLVVVAKETLTPWRVPLAVSRGRRIVYN